MPGESENICNFGEPAFKLCCVSIVFWLPVLTILCKLSVKIKDISVNLSD